MHTQEGAENIHLVQWHVDGEKKYTQDMDTMRVESNADKNVLETETRSKRNNNRLHTPIHAHSPLTYK